MRSLLISPNSEIIADTVARDYAEAIQALREQYDIVLLDSSAERWYDLIRLMKSGFRKLPGKIVPFGHDETELSKLRDAVRQVYGA